MYMSSPKTAKVGRASATPRKRLPRGGAKPASDEGMSKQDKANFIKAMAEGLSPKGAAKAKTAPNGSQTPVKVEILRKIPAVAKPAAIASNAQSDEALRLAALLEDKLAAGDLTALTPQATQALLAALCKLYAANVDAGDKFPAVGHRMAISGTEAMIMCGALLKAVDLQVFELGMWQSWSGL